MVYLPPRRLHLDNIECEAMIQFCSVTPFKGYSKHNDKNIASNILIWHFRIIEFSTIYIFEKISYSYNV